MPKPTNVATSKSAIPVKVQAKKAAKVSVAVSAKAQAKKPLEPITPTRKVNVASEKKPIETRTRAPAVRPRPEIRPEQRHCYVEVRAYFIAERNGFTAGRENEYWFAAEAEIDRMIEEGLLQPN
ncbi:MAG: DUF2934 domain-containing protein [Sterolibacterium sp.]